MTQARDLADGKFDTSTLVIDAANNRVGIGTATPDRSLHIAGSEPSVVFENTGQGTDLKTWRIYSNSSSLQVGTVDDAFSAGQNALEITRDNTDNITGIQFKTGASSERMRLTSAGSLGLGTSSPDALLQIEKSDSGTTINKEPASQSGPNIAIHNSNQTANNLSSVQFTNRGTNGVAETATAGIHVKHEAQGGTYSYGSMNFNVTNSAGSYATRIHISSDGDVGIGTSSPNEKLTIDSGAISFLGSLSTPSIGAGIFRPANNTLAFVTGSTERMRITSGGSVNIGGTGAQAKFEVNNAVSTAGSLTDTTINLATTGVTGRKANIGFGLAGGVANTNAATIGFDVTSGSGALQGDLFFSTRGSTSDSVPTERMRIDSSGRVTKPNQVAFSVTPQQGAYISTTPIPFSTAIMNIGNHFNTTNHTFTAPVDGRYLFHLHLGIVRVLSANASGYPRFRVNGGNTLYSYVSLPAATGYVNCNITGVLDLSANDTVKVSWNGSGTDYYGDQSECVFSGYLLG